MYFYLRQLVKCWSSHLDHSVIHYYHQSFTPCPQYQAGQNNEAVDDSSCILCSCPIAGMPTLAWDGLMLQTVCRCAEVRLRLECPQLGLRNHWREPWSERYSMACVLFFHSGLSTSLDAVTEGFVGAGTAL